MAAKIRFVDSNSSQRRHWSRPHVIEPHNRHVQRNSKPETECGLHYPRPLSLAAKMAVGLFDLLMRRVAASNPPSTLKLDTSS